jgi:hypothetical protein
MQTGLNRPKPERSIAVVLYGLCQGFQALAVCRPHPSQVPPIMSAHDEAGQRHLFKHGRMNVSVTTGGQKAVVQIARSDHETVPQGWNYRFREGADVDHAAIGIESVQARERSAAVAKLTVVVVFDNPCTCATRPLQERSSSRLSLPVSADTVHQSCAQASRPSLRQFGPASERGPNSKRRS